ncbi:MAG TPA: DUF6785 family protein, partial [Phycisphaerae bacterium]|nr:DUF6785 family protein [Phycisphaerae bacterium]
MPWDAWRTPLIHWYAILVIAAVAGVSLAVLLHRQWTRHEGLRYPIASFAEALLEREGERTAPPVVRNRLFWLALIAVLAIHVVNGIHAWRPGSIEIPLRWNVYPIMAKWTYSKQLPHWWILILPTIYPTVVAFAYFLSTEVSFSVGISHLVYVLLGG